MSRLDELIAELCPDGVEYKRFDETCTLHARIGWQRLTKAEYKTTGDYMLITGTDFTPSNEVNYKSCVYVSRERYVQDPKIQIKNGDILITKDGTLGKVAQVNNLPMPATLNGGVFVVRPKDESLLSRYIMYFLLSGHFQKVVEQQKTGSTISHLTQALFSRLLLPVPPLEVQREIVHILDSFTLLTAELTAELTARKKQYEFYRDKLLTSNRNIKKVKLGDVCTFVRGPFGGALKKEIFTSEGYAVYEQQHAIYRNLDFRYHIDKNKFSELKRFAVNPGDMIVSCSGTIGKTFVIPKNAPEGVINQALLKLTPNEVLNVFYLQYFFENTISKVLNGVARGGAIKNVPSVSELKLIELPLPSLAVQKKLVNVLDNFESICTDLNIGLPAEIEARQKQYEYYRDLLLTFAETGSTLITDRQTDRQS